MRGSRTVSRYVAREVVLYSLVGLAAVSVVFIGQNVLRYLAKFLMIGVSLSEVLWILRCVVIAILTYTVPIAFLFGALAAVGRMAADSEVLAMRSCGLGLRDLVLPVTLLGVVVSCITWYLALEVEHRVKRELREVLVSMTASGRMLESGRFTRVGDRVFYVESRDRDNQLSGVFVSDESDPDRPLLIFAERGRFSFDADTARVKIRLSRGEVHFDGEGLSGGGYDRMVFDSLEYVFRAELEQELSPGRVRAKDMTMGELRDVIARARSGESLDHFRNKRVEAYEIQVHRRLALPLAPTLFALAAVPLALRRGRGARAWGAVLCGLLVAGYYAILSFSQYLALVGVLPPALALWCPNLVFAAGSAELLRRARQGQG
jgi:lipopolysaccharide export system permease protein